MLSPGTVELIQSMLEREESYANDYHDDDEDWIRWAKEIDLCRAEIGLPLMERMCIVTPWTTRPMTMEESVRRHLGILNGEG